MNADDGVEVHRGATIRDIQLGQDGEPHRFVAVESGQENPREARWLVDASGRSRLIAKQQGLSVPEPELSNASSWARFEGVTDVDSLGPASFRSRVRHTARRLSTLHFCYPGYWIWFIPLRGGITSVGVVCEKRVFPAELRSVDGLVEFLRGHEAAASLLTEAKPVDHGCYLNIAYQTKQFFSGDRWGLSGEAACFADPFYSPGADFIALENDFLTDLIRRDHEGGTPADVASRAELYDQFMLFRQEATLRLYRDQYSLLGSYEACKLKWDLDVGSYYNLWVDAYLRDRHLDTAWLESQIAQRPHVLQSLENFRQLLVRVERELRERDDYHRRNLGEYNDGRDCLHFMEELGTEREDAAIFERQGEIFNRVRSDASRVLGVKPRFEELPLRRFMTRHSLL
jgi:flavin-dependent dehydrogenase